MIGTGLEQFGEGNRCPPKMLNRGEIEAAREAGARPRSKVNAPILIDAAVSADFHRRHPSRRRSRRLRVSKWIVAFARFPITVNWPMEIPPATPADEWSGALKRPMTPEIAWVERDRPLREHNTKPGISAAGIDGIELPEFISARRGQ